MDESAQKMFRFKVEISGEIKGRTRELVEALIRSNLSMTVNLYDGLDTGGFSIRVDEPFTDVHRRFRT